MRSKRAFTLVELIAVITILALLLILLIPNIMNVSDNSKESLRDSKIRTIVTSGEEYGNDTINDYQNCLGSRTSAELEENCTLTVPRLVRNGYLEGEEESDNIYDPVTNEAFQGRVLLCYNPVEVNVYGYYVEDDQYSCRDIAINADNTLNLSSIGGIGFVGGDDIEVSIIKSGSFTGFRCTVDNYTYADCSVVNETRLMIEPTDDRSVTFTDEYKEVTVTLYGDYLDNNNVSSTIMKKYSLKVYPTSMKVEDEGDYCMLSGSTKELTLVGENIGKVSVESNNTNTLEGTTKDNFLYLSAGAELGEATLTVRENNGNNVLTFTKDVYKLEVGDIPESMTLHKVVEVPITFGGVGNIVITSDNPTVARFSLDGVTYSESITLTGGETKFYFTAVDAGVGTVIIKGETCGLVEKYFSSTNLTLSEHETSVYIGGQSVTVDIESHEIQTYTCTSEDPTAAICELHGASVEIKAGTKAADEVKLHIRGSQGGYDIIKVKVLQTSIELVNSSGDDVETVCVSKDSNQNSTDVMARGINMGLTTIYNIGDWYLAEATIANNRLTLTKRQLSAGDAHDAYVAGYNTGITSIEVRESNGRATDSLNYHIYSLKLSSSSGTIKTDDTVEFNVTYGATGKISATSSNKDVATVEVVDVVDNEAKAVAGGSTTVNVLNTAKVVVKGEGSGSAVISIKGADCGEERYTIVVEGRTLSVLLEAGTYSTGLGANSISCKTEGTAKTCEAKFPDIYTSSEFQVVGYSKTKDDTDYEYKPGDKIELTRDLTGTTFYGNSSDVTRPVCSIPSYTTNTVIGEIAYMTLTCIDTGSGIDGNGNLTVDNFVSTDTTIGSVVEVGSPVPITNGYSYKIGIKSDKMGLFGISLNTDSIKDKFGNGNSTLSLNNIFSSEFESVGAWYIGKVTRSDVMAVLYNNKEYKGVDDGGYTLVMYGENEMLDYMTDDYSYYPPWYDYRTQITDVVINEGITNVGDGILYNASNVTNVTIPNTATYIGTRAFTYGSITNITIPDSVVTIEDYAFYGNPIVNLTLPQNVTSIGEGAFYNNQTTSLTIPNTVETIGNFAFATETDKTALQNLSFESNSNLTSIGEAAFVYHAVTNLVIPASVETIGNSAFAQLNTGDASTLTSLGFESGSKLTTIGDEAFFCAKLSSLTLPDSVESIGNRSFGTLREGVTTFNIGPNVRSLGNAFAYGKGLETFTVDAANTYFTAVNGVLYTADMETLVKCPDDYYKLYNTLDVPNTVKTLQAGSFEGWLDYGEAITAFTLNLPSGITNMNIDENFIFLTIGAINISENDEFTSVDGVLFNKDMTVIYRLPTAYNAEAYTIPDSVTTIADYFSYGNSRVHTITIPDSVTSIGYRALMSDAIYGFKTTNLNSGEDLTFDETSFAAMTYSETGNIAEQVKIINVKSDALKTKLETTYAGVPYTLQINVVS